MQSNYSNLKNESFELSDEDQSKVVSIHLEITEEAPSPLRIKDLILQVNEINLEVANEIEQDKKLEQISILDNDEIREKFSSSSSCEEVTGDDFKGPQDLQKENLFDITENQIRKQIRRQTYQQQGPFQKRTIERIHRRYQYILARNSNLSLDIKKSDKIVKVIAHDRIIDVYIHGDTTAAELICRIIKNFTLDYLNFPLAFCLSSCEFIEMEELINQQNNQKFIESSRFLSEEEKIKSEFHTFYNLTSEERTSIGYESVVFPPIVFLDINNRIKENFGLDFNYLDCLKFKNEDSRVIIVQIIRKFMVTNKEEFESIRKIYNDRIVDTENRFSHHIQRSRDLDHSEEKINNEKSDLIMIERFGLIGNDKRIEKRKIITVCEKQFPIELLKNQIIGDIIEEIQRRKICENLNNQDYGLRLRYSSQKFSGKELDFGMLIEGLPIPWVQIFRRNECKRSDRNCQKQKKSDDEQEFLDIQPKKPEESKWFNYEEFKMIKLGQSRDDFVTVGLDYFDMSIRVERSVTKGRVNLLKSINKLFKKVIYYLIEDVEPIKKIHQKILIQSIKSVCTFDDRLLIEYNKHEKHLKAINLKVDDSGFDQTDKNKKKEQSRLQMKKIKQKLDYLIKIRSENAFLNSS